MASMIRVHVQRLTFSRNNRSTTGFSGDYDMRLARHGAQRDDRQWAAGAWSGVANAMPWEQHGYGCEAARSSGPRSACFFVHDTITR